MLPVIAKGNAREQSQAVQQDLNVTTLTNQITHVGALGELVQNWSSMANCISYPLATMFSQTSHTLTPSSQG